jgi:Arc/MetJ family transcription regulator
MCIINTYHTHEVIMRTNIVIDDELIKQAMAITNIHTKREVVEEALKLLLRMNKQKEILKYRGKLKWEGNLDEMRTDK